MLGIKINRDRRGWQDISAWKVLVTNGYVRREAGSKWSLGVRSTPNPWQHSRAAESNDVFLFN